jgi:transposase-like protein
MFRGSVVATIVAIGSIAAFFYVETGTGAKPSVLDQAARDRLKEIRFCEAAESYAPGAVVSEVARQNDISPQHLFAGRKAARAGLLSLPGDEAPMSASASGPQSSMMRRLVRSSVLISRARRPSPRA